jgi:hypothetical protein
MVGTSGRVAGSRPGGRGGSVEKLATFVFGVVFLAVMLGLALLVPHPSESQSFIFRAVVAAAAGGAVVFLPGAVNVDIRPSIRAGGALGVFALVYAFNPPSTSPAPAPTPSASKYSLELKLISDPAERLKLDPFGASVLAMVNNDIVFSDNPQDPKNRSNAVRRGLGGIVAEFSNLAPGDKLLVVVKQGNLSWHSDEMKMPEANLAMSPSPLPMNTGGGQ